MSNNLSNFDQSIRASLDGYSAPYDANSWSSMAGKLDATSSSTSSNYLWAALVAASLFIGTGIYLYYYVQNVACEAQLVTNTMKVDRGIGYAGVNSKMESAGSGVHVADDQMTETDGGNVLDNGLASNDLVNDSNGNSAIESQSNSNADSELNASSRSHGGDNSDANAALNADGNLALEAASSGAESNSNDNSSNNSDEINGGSSIADDSAFVEDEVANENDLAFAPNLSEACVGVEVTFDLQTGDVDGNYLWNFGDGNFSNAPNPTHKYAKSGSYDISLSVTSKKDGKIRSNTMKEMILINPKPNADFEWEFVNTPGHEPLVSFKNTSEMATDCVWVFDEENTTTEINPSTSYDSKGRHVVRLSAENEFGCIDEKYAYISIDSDYNLLAQETMTPGLDGPQGVFMPLGLKKKDVDFKLTVYDNKQPIFETTNKFKPWDGQDPDGQVVESGDYPWVVIIYNRYGEEEKYYSGTITITP